jgi:hypothetical protein
LCRIDSTKIIGNGHQKWGKIIGNSQKCWRIQRWKIFGYFVFFKFSIIKFALKDFIAIDLNSPRLNQFITDLDGSNQLLDAIIFSAGNAEILMSFVAGQMRFGRRGAIQ